MKDFAEDRMKMTQKLNFVLGRVENNVGKGENAFFPTLFSKVFFLGVVISRDCVVKSYKQPVESGKMT